MTKDVKGQRLYVNISASQARKRLSGHGFGVKKVESAGTNRAAIVHTATGQHLRELESLFHDVLPCGEPADEGPDEPSSPR